MITASVMKRLNASSEWNFLVSRQKKNPAEVLMLFESHWIVFELT